MSSRIMRPMTPFTLHREHASVLIIDFQIRLFQAMDETYAFRHAKNAEHLVYASSAFDLPLLVTEQKKLGKTMPSLHVSEDTPVFDEKLNFSCLNHPGFADALRKTGRKQVIVGGMETHVCVAQTVRDLLIEGYEVVVAGDACLSRRNLDWRQGLARMERDGAHRWSTESILFELLGSFEGATAKEISRRIR